MTKTTPYLLTAVVLLGMCTPAQGAPAASPGCTASYDPTGPRYEVECRTTCRIGWNEATVVGPGVVAASMTCVGGAVGCIGVMACTAPMPSSSSGSGTCRGTADGPSLRLYCHNVGTGQVDAGASKEQECPSLLPAPCLAPVPCLGVHGDEMPEEATILAPFLAVPSVFVWGSDGDAFFLSRGPDGDCGSGRIPVASPA